ncbi:MAG: ABC transporter ATP-binding protein [Salinivirgaceae bacterium]|jgi:iron complex transport system ATP-binding protein
MEIDSINGLTIKNLAIGYHKDSETHQLGGIINAQAKPGSLIALIGPNGVGKSTLIRTICQLHPSLAGQVIINSVDSAKLSRIQMAKTISLVSTDLYRSSKLKVADLVELGRFPHGSWFSGLSAYDKNCIKISMEQVNISSLAQRDITELSDGEYQRAMIARALAQDTPIVLLDEPTAFLDLATKFSMVSLLWNLTRNNQKSILFSTHDINIAMQFADVFWVLTKDGLKVGAPEDLLIDGTLEDLYTGTSVFFDSSTLQFRNKKTKLVPIQVIGTGKEYQFTLMALDRLGFDTDCNNSQALTVKIIATKQTTVWKFAHGNNTLEFNSIYELQEALREFV